VLRIITSNEVCYVETLIESKPNKWTYSEKENKTKLGEI
jgi:hypothetical protein